MKNIILFILVSTVVSCGQGNSKKFNAGTVTDSQNASSTPGLNNRIDPVAFAQSSLMSFSGEVSELRRITFPNHWPNFDFTSLDTVLNCLNSSRPCSAARLSRLSREELKVEYVTQDLSFTFQGRIDLENVNWKTSQEQQIELRRLSPGSYELQVDEDIFTWSTQAQMMCFQSECVDLNQYE